jgi:hypothetical protein
MALAIARWRGEEADGHHRFDVDVGANRFYAWAIGSGIHRRDGVPMLTSRSYTSPLLGPLEPGTRGRAVLRVPSDAFTSDDHHLQLLSFRDEELRGPAASDVVEVPWRWAAPARRQADPTGAASSFSAPGRDRRPVPQLSHAQFLDVLSGLVSRILPAVQGALPTIQQLLPMVGKLFAPAGAPAAGAPAAAPAAAAPAGQPDLAQLLSALLAQIQKAIGPQPPAATPSPGKQASLALSSPHRYSYASWAQLLAALPALSGLLEKVLTPETVQTLVQAGDPTKMVTTLINGATEAAKIGQESYDKLHEHLRALNPGLGDDVLIPLLMAVTASTEGHRGRPQHLMSRLVRLGIADLAPVELGGYPQVAFRRGDPITLPVTVDTPRPIPRARLEICIKDAQTLRWLAERRWSFRRLEAGRLPTAIVLPTGLTARLESGREYLLDLTLTWPGRDGLVGATTSQLIRVVGDLVFDSLDSGGPPIRLDDVDRDRSWWHRVWTADLGEPGRMTADLEYRYRLAPGLSAGTRRTETDVELHEESARRSSGTLGAGLDVSPAELSRLAARLTGDAFSPEVMSALTDPAFGHAFDRAAHSTVSLRGRRGARAAVWVWPEVKLHQALCSEPADISPVTGQVLTFRTVPVQVPVPALAHVVTTRTP